jgi:hypothetical protein
MLQSPFPHETLVRASTSALVAGNSTSAVKKSLFNDEPCGITIPGRREYCRSSRISASPVFYPVLVQHTPNGFEVRSCNPRIRCEKIVATTSRSSPMTDFLLYLLLETKPKRPTLGSDARLIGADRHCVGWHGGARNAYTQPPRQSCSQFNFSTPVRCFRTRHQLPRHEHVNTEYSSYYEGANAEGRERSALPRTASEFTLHFPAKKASRGDCQRCFCLTCLLVVLRK